MNKLVLSEIWIYPVKSLGGVLLDSARVDEKGLRYDRRWMLIDETGTFLTQRIHFNMALLKTSLMVHNGKPAIAVSQGDDAITLPDPGAGGEMITATVWDDTVSVVEVSSLHSEWFSEKLNIKCRLVYFPEHNPRPVDPRYEINRENVSLADGYPFLIIGEQSLADLNGRMDVPLPMNRFRPNLVFSGGQPFEEDKWRNFKIGTNRFIGVKPCARCVLTTIDQETAARGKEPLKTLAGYRSWNNKIYFGQNVIAVDHGEIKKGDEIVLG